jgi:hypothetical protein
MSALYGVVGVTGSVVVCWFGVRLVATAVDIFDRWKRSRAGDPNAWEV